MTKERAAIRKPARHRGRRARSDTISKALATRVTAELCPAVNENGEVIPGLRFLLDGEPLYPDDMSIFDAEDDEEVSRAKIVAYLLARGVEDPLELSRLIAAWRQLYFAPSYALPSC